MNKINATMQLSEFSYSQILPLLLGGMVLGVIFFAGLYWTVRQATQSVTPARYFLGSFLLRTAVALGGFYLLSDGQWPRLLIAITGFIGVRIAVMVCFHSWRESSKKQEARDAP